MNGLESIGGASFAQGALAHGGSAEEAKASPDGLTDGERQQVQALKQRDQEVRAHERAHQAAAGAYGGGASYSFVRGPDGRQYAVGGEVQIDASPVPGNPKATIAKMETVSRAALAPAQPSSQDHRVAAQAQAAKAKAQVELADTAGSEDEQIDAILQTVYAARPEVGAGGFYIGMAGDQSVLKQKDDLSDEDLAVSPWSLWCSLWSSCCWSFGRW